MRVVCPQNVMGAYSKAPDVSPPSRIAPWARDAGSARERCFVRSLVPSGAGAGHLDHRFWREQVAEAAGDEEIDPAEDALLGREEVSVQEGHG